MPAFDPRRLAADCLDLLPQLRWVRVDPAAVERAAAALSRQAPPLPRWDHPAFVDRPGDALDTQIWLGNALNFCYWVPPGEAMWRVDVAGRPEVDVFALMGAIRRALDAGLDLGDARTLRHEARAVLGVGQGTLPLLERRVEILQELAAALQRDFDGRLDNAVRAAGRDAPGVAAFLGATFPSFHDTRILDGQVLSLYKRAQLCPAMLHARRLALGAPGLDGTDRLTVFADYMLPRVLRRLGVLGYAPALARRVDGRQDLAAGEQAEVELRVATVGACELLLERARGQDPTLDMLRLDHWLWSRGADLDSPHHRTVTTDY